MTVTVPVTDGGPPCVDGGGTVVLDGDPRLTRSRTVFHGLRTVTVPWWRTVIHRARPVMVPRVRSATHRVLTVIHRGGTAVPVGPDGDGTVVPAGARRAGRTDTGTPGVSPVRPDGNGPVKSVGNRSGPGHAGTVPPGGSSSGPNGSGTR